MKISRKSWHYRLNNWARGWRFDQRVSDGQHTTCSYFWTTVGSLFMLIVFTLAITAGISLAISGAVGLGWLGLNYFGLAPMVPSPLAVMAIIVGIFLAAGIIGKLGSLAAMYIGRKLDEWETRQNRWKDAPKEPGFINQFLKDKKDKVCTIVKVE